jgi:Ca-activated chloride channel family protein
VLFGSFALAQSGRNKPPIEKEKKTNPTGVAPSPTPTPKPMPKLTPTPTPTPTPKINGEVDENDVIRVDSNLVTIPASIVDREGTPITNLRLEDFELLIDGQVKTISAMSRSETPVKLALLFDNSSSIDKAREFEKQAAVKFFKRVLRPIDQAAIYSVTDKIVLVQALTNNVRQLTQAIEYFGKPEGATSLIDATAQAAKYLKNYQERKVIVIVSDGEDTTSDLSFEEMVRIVQNAGCQVYVVNTKQFEYMALTGKPSGNANILALTAERRMQEITDQTGGAVYSPLSNKDLDNAFSLIAAELSQQYVLNYYIVDDPNDGGFRVITLRTPQHKDLRIRARKGYYSPTR